MHFSPRSIGASSAAGHDDDLAALVRCALTAPVGFLHRGCSCRALPGRAGQVRDQRDDAYSCNPCGEIPMGRFSIGIAAVGQPTRRDQKRRRTTKEMMQPVSDLQPKRRRTTKEMMQPVSDLPWCHLFGCAGLLQDQRPKSLLPHIGVLIIPTAAVS